MKNIISFFIQAFVIFISIKIYTKGYIKKGVGTQKKEKNDTNKNNLTSSIYLPRNETCSSLGRHTWAVLHSIAASYPNKPNATEKENYSKFLNGLLYHYPSKNNIMKEIMKEHPIENESREELVYYICEIHNLMNKKLSKSKFKCREAFDIWGGDCGCDS